MMKVGGKKILMSESLFVPDGDEALVECFIAEGDILRLKYEFLQEPEIETEGVLKSPDARFVIDYVTEENSKHLDLVVVKFFNFNKAFGQTFVRPVAIADSNAKEILYLFASVQKLGEISRIDFQIMLGDSE